MIPSDTNHPLAAEWLSNNKQPLVTTDYVVDELLTLLRARVEEASASRLGTQLFSGEIAQVYYLSRDDVGAAWQVFRTYNDKEWSFTDCTSKVILEKLGLTQAFAFYHFLKLFSGGVRGASTTTLYLA